MKMINELLEQLGISSEGNIDSDDLYRMHLLIQEHIGNEAAAAFLILVNHMITVSAETFIHDVRDLEENAWNCGGLISRYVIWSDGLPYIARKGLPLPDLSEVKAIKSSFAKLRHPSSPPSSLPEPPI